MKKRLFYIFILICQVAFSQDYSDFSKGYEYYLAGDFDNAIKYFNKSIDENPKHGDSYYFKALLLARTSSFDDALILFNKAIELNPDDGAYYGDRGILFANMGNADQALQDFIFAAKHDSLNPARHFNIAAFYLNQGDCEKAIPFLSKCLKVDNNHLKARFKRAICYIQILNTDLAIEDFSFIINNYENQSTSLNPYDFDELLGVAYYFRGGIYGEQKKYKNCVSDLKNAIKYNDTDAEIFNSLGYYMIFTNEIENGIKYLDKSIEMSPAVNNYNSRSFAYYKLGEYKKAEKDAIAAMNLDKENPETYYNLALIYCSTNKNKEACKMKKKAIALDLEKAKDIKIVNCDND